jgi:hypothetical protein
MVIKKGPTWESTEIAPYPSHTHFQLSYDGQLKDSSSYGTMMKVENKTVYYNKTVKCL